MLTGQNGILTQAQNAKEKTSIAQEKEQIILAYNAVVTKKQSTDVTYDDLNDEFEASKVGATASGADPITVKFEESQRTYTIDANGNISDPTTGTTPPDEEDEVAGKYYETDTEITVGDETITIPGGATVSKIPGEYENIGNGFVIYITNKQITDEEWQDVETMQKTYDQFVWVPVEKAYVTVEEMGGDTLDNLESYITANDNKVYPMAVKSGDTYSGILYDFTDGENGVTITPYDYKTTSSYREPEYLEDSSYADNSTYNQDANGNKIVTEENLQAEYKEMVEGVNAKGGFWVGRYETSSMVNEKTQDATNVIKVVKGTTNGINNVDWYRMYAQQKNYDDLKLTKSNNVKSSMIWGSQWDQIMIWMKDEENKTNGKFYITNSSGMGNFNLSGVDDGYDDPNNPAETGCFDVKNIFDLAGNVYDWTLEAIGTINRVLRRRLLRRY